MADLQIVAGLDVDKSARLIENQIKNELPNKINQNVGIIGELNVSKTTEIIQGQLSKMNLKGLTIKDINVDTNAFKNVNSQITNISDKMVNAFNKTFSIKSDETLNANISQLLSQYANGDISQQASAFEKLNEIIKKQSEYVVKDKNEFENFKNAIRSFGKIHIDETLNKDLRDVLGNANEVKKVLNTLFGSGGYARKQGKGYGDFSGLLGTDARFKEYTADAEGLLNLYKNFISLKNGNTANFFERGGDIENVRTFLNELTKVNQTTKETVVSNSQLSNTYNDLIAKVNGVGGDLKVTEAEFLRLQNLAKNGVFKIDESGGFKFITNQLGVMRGLIVEDNQALQQTGNIVNNISREFANLTNKDKASFGAVFSNGMLDADATLQKIENRFKNIQGITGVKAEGRILPTLVGMNGDTPIYEDMLSRITVSMKNTEGESRALTFSLKELNGELNTFTFDSASYSDSGISQQLNQINTKATNLTNTIEKLKAKYTDVNAVKAIKDNNNLSELDNKYQVVIQNIERLKTANLSTMTSIENETKKAITEYERLAITLQNSEYMATSLRTKDIATIQSIANQDLKKFEEQIKNSRVPISELNTELTNLQNVIAQPLNKEELMNYLNNFDIAKAKFQALSEQYRGIQQQEQTLQQYGKSIDTTINKLNGLSSKRIFDTNSSNSSVVAMRTTIGELVQKYEQLKSTMGEIKTPEQFKKFEAELTNLNNQFNKATESAKNLQRQFQNDNSSIALGNRVQSLRNQISKFMSDNGKAMNNGYRNQFDTMLNSLNTVANTGDFNKIKSKFQELTGEINRLGLRGNSVMDSLRQKVSKFASWMGITMITSSISREIRGMYEDVITLDTALVDLNKTFQGTSADLEDFYYNANKVAKQLGSTTEEIINSASSWSRLGYNTKESAIAMAETSSIFASVSPDLNLDEATSSLTSILKAYQDYGITTDNALEEVVSKINHIGNLFSTTNGDISAGLQRSASSMAMAGEDFNKAVAVFTSAQEIVQDAESVGIKEMRFADFKCGYIG